MNGDAKKQIGESMIKPKEKKVIEPASHTPFQDNFNKNNNKLLASMLIFILLLAILIASRVVSNDLTLRKHRVETQLLSLRVENKALKEEIAELELIRYELAEARWRSLSMMEQDNP